MPRIARAVVSGIPHHVTQKGNRGQNVFFSDQDRLRYLSWLKTYADRAQLEVWAYCLMSNHVHFVVVPKQPDALAEVFRSLHTRHAQWINREKGWRGHLWQGRFYSCAMDDAHLMAAIRYVESNPVRAGLVKYAEKYPWSSAAGHCGLRHDEILTNPTFLKNSIENWRNWLSQSEKQETINQIRRMTEKGLPCGNSQFVKQMERKLRRSLLDRPRGRPRKNESHN